MDNETLMQLLVLGLAAASVGAIVFIGVFPYISGEKRVEKRIEGVAKGKVARTVRTGSTADELLNRKKQVQENLKDLEKRQKSNKLTLRTRLMRAGIEATPRTFHIASALTGVVAIGAALLSGAQIMVAILIAFPVGLGLPRWVLNFLVKRRQAKFLEHFADAIDIIVRGVKTGLPLNECLEIIARESSEPIAGEFAELVEQTRVGVTISECFDRMMDRMPVPEVSFFAIVISIQQQAGGNLAEALGNLSGVLRARKQLAAKVKALSGEAKASAAILGALPFVVVSMVYMTSPDYISLLWQDKMGTIMLAVAGFWMLCGILMMRKMINFKY